MKKLLLRLILTVAVIVLVGLIGSGVYVYRAFWGSLARLDGEASFPGLAEKVLIERDAQGVPTITTTDEDARAFAVGYLHAQDRFFQMDLLRRVAAGEVSELVGEVAVNVDKLHRMHQFRKRSSDVIAAASEQDRAVLDAYAAGVNSGLKDLGAKPPEYYLLGTEPRTWVPEDTVLCLFAMFLDLQGDDYRAELDRHTSYAALPKPLADFVWPKGSHDWDAPIIGEPLDDPPIPGSDVVNLRSEDSKWPSVPDPTTAEMFGTVNLGSNGWAVSGKHTKHGGAIVADDMHLGIRVPNIWYRLSFVLPPEKEGDQTVVATGVSLPGAASIVVGSNGSIAWAFTNSEGDWSDLIVIDVDPNDPNKYLTPDGPKPFELETETIAVKGGEEESITIQQTIWGPIIGEDYQGKPLALRWVAHDTEGVNLLSARIVFEQTLDDALLFAAQCGSPAQNFTIGDKDGRIAWTIMGRIPSRTYDGWMPQSWTDGKNRWTGYLKPEDYPKVVDPESGKIWTANARIVSGELLEKVGFGPYDMGARQKQIRDGMLALETADEKDMLAIQLDDRAIFWERWQKLLVDLLDEEALEEHPLRAETKKHVEEWGGKASVDSVGFRIVRLFHLEVSRRTMEWLTGPCRKSDPKFRVYRLPRSIECSVWALASQKPMHLLDPQYQSWNECLLSCLDHVIADATKDDRSLSDYTWGEYNTLEVNHPLSNGLRETLGESWVEWMELDMPHVPVSGGSRNIPKILRPRSGASERLGVSPGREKDGYFHMPAGQSGHPLSPYYRIGHQDWVDGTFSPFLPGETKHTLRLSPRPE